MGQERPICDGRAVIASPLKAIESLVAPSTQGGQKRSRRRLPSMRLELSVIEAIAAKFRPGLRALSKG
jgi:hypothetical protein